MAALLQTEPPPSPAPGGNLTAIAPAQARDHLDALWDRLLDVDSLDKAACPAKA
jgi:hypothetical protein